MAEPYARERGYNEVSGLSAERQALVNGVRDHADSKVAKSPDTSTVWDDWSRELSLHSDREINEQIGPKVTTVRGAVKHIDDRYTM